MVKSEVAKTNFLSICAPYRLAAAALQLTDEQRVVVCQMSFDSLLQLTCGRLRRKLCRWLIEKLDTARCIFRVKWYWLSNKNIEEIPPTNKFRLNMCSTNSDIL